MGGVVTISEPHLVTPADHRVTLDRNGVLRAGELFVSVKPQNARVGLLTVGPLVPLIPVGSGNELGKGKPFQILVQFETSDPRLHLHGGRDLLTPSRYGIPRGPVGRPTESYGDCTRAAKSFAWPRLGL
jgi:hypothetical protein